MSNYTGSSTKVRNDIRSRASEIISLYDSGLTSYEISLMFGASRTLITKTIKLNGGVTRMPGKRFLKHRVPWNKGIRYTAILGDKNPNWRGGVTSLNSKIRHCIEYKLWIRSVFERDNYTCVKCRQRGGNIEADHFPVMFSHIMRENKITSYEDAQKCDKLWDVRNGRTLCLKCHNRTKQVRSRFKKFSNKM